MSNAIQLFDASDVTRMKKNRALYQNYVQLAAKQQLPVGGIPHEDLMAVARYGATYIPAESLTATVVEQANCPACPNTVQWNTTEIAVQPCAVCEGSSYQPGFYRELFPNVQPDPFPPPSIWRNATLNGGPFEGIVYSVGYANGTWVAMGYDDIYTSTDGVNWTGVFNNPAARMVNTWRSSPMKGQTPGVQAFNFRMLYKNNGI
jgi:hypothetical protein